MHSRNVPDSHILSLNNEEATTVRIVSALLNHFLFNDDIRSGDAMVFFYAGYVSHLDSTSNAASQTHGSGESDMNDAIISYDATVSLSKAQLTHCITAKTLNRLLSWLSSLKGDNIVRSLWPAEPRDRSS